MARVVSRAASAPEGREARTVSTFAAGPGGSSVVERAPKRRIRRSAAHSASVALHAQHRLERVGRLRELVGVEVALGAEARLCDVDDALEVLGAREERGVLVGHRLEAGQRLGERLLAVEELPDQEVELVGVGGQVELWRVLRDLQEVGQGLAVARVGLALVDDLLEARERRLVEAELEERHAQEILRLLDDRVLLVALLDQLVELDGGREIFFLRELGRALGEPLAERGVGDGRLLLEGERLIGGARRPAQRPGREDRGERPRDAAPGDAEGPRGRRQRHEDSGHGMLRSWPAKCRCCSAGRKWRSRRAHGPVAMDPMGVW